MKTTALLPPQPPSQIKPTDQPKVSPLNPSQKLFLRPGTIEEEEEEESETVTKRCDDEERVYAEVLLRHGQCCTVGTPKVPSFSRVSTCNSSLTYVATRQESYR